MCTQALGEALTLASSLVREWESLLEADVRAGRREARAGALRLDLASLQGAAATFLCAAEPVVRRAALDLLADLRSLHRALQAAGADAGAGAGAGASLRSADAS